MANDRLSISIDAIDNASKTLGGIGNAAQDAGGKFNTLGDHVSRAAGNLAKIGAGVALGGILALGSGVVGLATSGLTLNNSMEKVSAQLNAFTKDSGKTADIIEIVRQRAAKTPFEFDAMAKAAVALFPASKTAQGGLEGILEKAEILAASNPAEGLEGAAFALKEAVSGDFTSIIERFNLPRQFINDLKKKGVPDLEIVQRAMKEMGLDVDLVSNLANTAEGRWSTFKDTLANVAAQATKPIFTAMSEGIAQVNTYLDANGPLLNEIGATIAGILTTAIQDFVAFIPTLVTGFNAISEGVKFFETAIKQAFSGENLDASSVFLYALEKLGIQVPDILKTVVFAVEDGFGKIPEIINQAALPFSLLGVKIALLELTVQPILVSILESVKSIFGELMPIALTSGMGAWTLISTTIQTVINSAIAIINTWLPVVQTVLSGIAAFLRTHGEEIQLLVSTAWNTVTSIIQTVINTITEIINAFAPVVTEVFGAISAFLETNGSDILAFLTSAWNSIGEIISGVAAIVKRVVTTVFGEVASFLKTHGDDIQRVLTGAWNFIKVTVGESINIIKGIVNTVLAVINGDWDTAWKNIQSVTESVNKIIQKTIETAMGVIEGVIKLAVDNFKLGWEQGWKLMQDATSAAWETIKAAINTGIETAKTAIANGVEAFMSKFREMRDKMSVIGNQIMEGLIQGIRDKVGWLIDEGVRAGTVVIDAIKNTLGINSPAKEAIPLGEGIDEGLGVGIVNAIGIPVGAAEDMAIQTIERASKALMPIAEVISSAIDPAISQTVSQFSGLADDVENQLLTVAESFVELAETGDTSSLHFAQSFEAIKRAFAELVPSFGDVQKNFDVLFATMASGEFDVDTFWDAWGRMLHEVKIGTAATLDEVNRGLINTYAVFEDGSYTLLTLEERMQMSFSKFSGLADDVENQLLTVAESFVELAETGDTSSLHFAQSFEAIKRAFAELVPSFGDVQNNFDVLFATMASGKFDVDTFWDAWGRMLHEVKIGTAATLSEVNQGLLGTYTVFEDGSYVLNGAKQNMSSFFVDVGNSSRWFAEQMEDQILFAAEMFVELAQTGDHSSLLFAQSFEAIRQKINELVPSFDGGQAAMQAMHAAMASGKFDVEAYWAAYADLVNQVKTSLGITQQNVQTATQNIATVATGNASTTRDNVNGAFENILVVAGVAINTLTGEVLSSSDTMSSAMDRLANTVTGATQTMQTQASAAAQAVAASMIAAGQVINMTQQQLANFVQAGGVGGITGSTYTPSPAFQALFTNQPAPAPPPLSSGPTQDTTTNNNNVTVQIDVFGVDERTVKHEMREGILDGLRQSGLSGGMYAT